MEFVEISVKMVGMMISTAFFVVLISIAFGCEQLVLPTLRSLAFPLSCKCFTILSVMVLITVVSMGGTIIFNKVRLESGERFETLACCAATVLQASH